MTARSRDTIDLIPIAREVRLAAQSLARHVKDHTPSLAPHLFTVLAWLEEGPATAGDLAGRERVSAPSMSRSVSELEERGYVSRTVDPSDARQKIVSLTASGRRALSKGRKDRDEYVAALLVNCTPDELADLQRGAELLRKVVEQ
ncbi:MAG: MarR family winged helix-turn-helix transcriptional regulator [Propionibacteriaceae bacterium]